jgi:hypothetical protein
MCVCVCGCVCERVYMSIECVFARGYVRLCMCLCTYCVRKYVYACVCMCVCVCRCVYACVCGPHLEFATQCQNRVQLLHLWIWNYEQDISRGK